MRLLIPLLLLGMLVQPLQAQVPSEFEPGASVLTREDLVRLRAEYEQALSSPVYSGAVKNQIRRNLERVRQRLEIGDFRVGDRVALNVQGEATIPDTVPVLPGPKISLEVFGDIPLHGVLRSEIQEHLTKEIGRFIRDPIVTASALMRISIQGGVGNPGFFVLPTSMLLTEALMYAGGPSNADLDDIRIERAGDVLMDGEAVQESIVEGRTLDQLNLQAGDQIFVPTSSAGGNLLATAGRFALIAATTLIFGIRVF